MVLHENHWKCLWLTGPCAKDIVSSQVRSESPATSEQGLSSEVPMKVSDNEEDKESVSSWGFTHSVTEWLSKWRKSKDNSPVKQDACLDKKDEVQSSTFQSLPGVTYLTGLFEKGDTSTKATVHGTSKPNTAKPKGEVSYLYAILLSSGFQFSLLIIIIVT